MAKYYNYILLALLIFCSPCLGNQHLCNIQFFPLWFRAIEFSWGKSTYPLRLDPLQIHDPQLQWPRQLISFLHIPSWFPFLCPTIAVLNLTNFINIPSLSAIHFNKGFSSLTQWCLQHPLAFKYVCTFIYLSHLILSQRKMGFCSLLKITYPWCSWTHTLHFHQNFI